MEEKKLLIQHSYKSASTFMIVLGGQVTLTAAFLSESPQKGLAFFAMILMLFASIGTATVAEQIIREMNPKPTFKLKSINWLLGSYLPTSTNAQYVHSFLSGIMFLVSLGIFGLVLYDYGR